MKTDFQLLWRAYALSRFGVAFSAGAVAVIAVTELGYSAVQVGVVIGGSRLAAAVLSFPIGLLIEQRRKRPVLIGTDVGRSVATLAIPVLLLVGGLSQVALMVALTLDFLFSVASASAYGAHIKDLLEEHEWQPAFAKLQSADWVFTALFTPLGGVIVSLVGATVTLSIDALTYLGSAVLIARLRKPERRPGSQEIVGIRDFASKALGGWRYIHSLPELKALYRNAMLFGGFLVLISPLVAVLVLRDLGLAAWQYGLILGVPAVGGVLGAQMSSRALDRLGLRRAILYLGSARTLWTFWLAFAPDGSLGLAYILIVESALMLVAGAFNPSFSTYQISITDDDFLARVGATWSASAMIVQPTFMILGGLLSGLIGLRPTIAAAGVGLMASSLLLPWRSPAERFEKASGDNVPTASST